MKKALAILIALVVAFGAGVVVGMFGLGDDGKEKYDVVVLEEQIIDISELASVKMDYSDLSTYKGAAKKLFGHDVPFTSKEMQIHYSGTIKAGPNLEEGLDVKVDGDKINVSIPHSQILSHTIDEGSMEIVYIDNGVFNRVTPENTNQLRKDAKEKMEKRFIDKGILQQADEKAVDQITSFLEAACPDAKITVEFK